MSDLRVSLVLAADGSAARAEVARTQSAIGRLGPTGTAATRQIEQGAASATRGVAEIGAASSRAAVQMETALAARGSAALARLDGAIGRTNAAMGRFVTTVQGGGNAFGAFAATSSRLAGALAGGLAGLAVQVGVVAAQMLFARSSTDQLAAATMSHEDALKYANDRLKTSAQLAREAADARDELARATLASTRAIQAETLALLQADAEFAAASVAAAQNEASRPRRRGTLQGAAATLSVQGGQQAAAEIAAAITAAERALADTEAALANLARPRAAGGGQGGAQGGAIDELLARLKASASQLEAAVMTPLERYNGELARMRELLDRGLISQETYERGLDRAGDALARATAEAEGAAGGIGRLEGAFERLSDDVNGFGRDAARALADALTGVRALDGGIGGLMQRLASGVLQKLIYEEMTRPLAQAASQLLRMGGQFVMNMFDPAAGTRASLAMAGPSGNVIPPLHTGGIAGVDAPMGFRAVAASAFAGAPRLHAGGMAGGGLGAGEVPAILKRGEGVFTPQQMRALGPAGGDVSVTVIDQRGANAPPIETREREGAGGMRMIEMIVREQVSRGIADGSFDRPLAMSYGLRRAGMR
jgi:hypothetical protein